MEELASLSPRPLAAVARTFAQDATGWFDHKYGKEQTKREWVKRYAMTGTLTNVGIKRRFGEALNSKTYEYQVNEVLCKVISCPWPCKTPHVWPTRVPTGGQLNAVPPI